MGNCVHSMRAILELELSLRPSMELVDLQKILFQAAFGADHMLRWAVRDPELFRASFTREWEHASMTPPEGTPVFQIVDPDGRIARLHISAAAAAGFDPEHLIDLLLKQPWLNGDSGRADTILGQAALLGSPSLLPWTWAQIREAGMPQAPPSHSRVYGETHYRLVNDWESMGLRASGRAVRLAQPGQCVEARS